MNKLTKANEQRQNNALDKLYSFEEGVSNYRQLIKTFTFNKCSIDSVPKYKYNRVKFNRMDWNEQIEYERKMELKKVVYNLYYKKDNCFREVPKMVYEYFLEWFDNNHCCECKKPMNEMETNYGLENMLCCIHCYNDTIELTNELLKN